jgi:hypothetical protein
MIIAVCVFVAFALIVSPFMITLDWNIGSASADTLDVGLAGFASLLIWLNLGIALLLAGIHRGMPWWSWGASLLVMPIYLFAGYSVPELVKDGGPDRWMTANVVLDGLLILAYIAWLLRPGWSSLVSANQAAGIVWGAIFALSIIPVSKNIGVSDREQKRAEARARPAKERVAQLQHLPADAPVKDLMEFVGFEETSQDAKQRILSANNKDAQLAQLVCNGDERTFGWLTSLDVAPSPAICDCVRNFLKVRVAEAKRTKGNSISGLDRQLPTLKWAAKNKCPMQEELSAYIAIMRVYYPDAKNTYEPSDEIERSLQAP